MKTIMVSGHKVKAFCEQCQEFVPATYSYGDFPFDRGVIAENILRATCNNCGTIVSVALQSAPMLKEALEAPEFVRTTMRLPQELMDFVGVQLDKMGSHPSKYDLYLKALISACHGKEEKISQLLQSLTDPVLERPNAVLVRITLTPRLHEIVRVIAKLSGISNLSELLRRLLVLSESAPLNKPVATEASRLLLALT
jgi:hypothetical protein